MQPGIASQAGYGARDLQIQDARRIDRPDPDTVRFRTGLFP
jgi:hypothetical protein